MSRNRKRKLRVVLTSLALCAAAALTGLSWAGQLGLENYRAAARYSAGRAFEETVAAVDSLSGALSRSVYATDEGLCRRICAEIYASAAAAESAMATLPFATQELERLSSFLNVAGDYAYSLGADTEGFDEQQREHLRKLAEAARGLSENLQTLRQDVDNGEVRMDSREQRLRNVGEEEGELLSTRMLGYEADFEPPERLLYDGKYGCEEEEIRGWLTEEGMREQAAAYAGTAPEDLDLLYDYAGSDSRRCYRTGDLFLCVSRRGVESMAQARLVSEAMISPEEALTLARDFLEARGFSDLELTESRDSGTVCAFRFCRVQDGAVCLDNALSIAVARDDGTVYSFSAEDYCAEDAEAEWDLTAEEAAAALPANLKLLDSRRVICKSEGKRDLACYELSCLDGERSVRVYVDASDGRQVKIEL